MSEIAAFADTFKNPRPRFRRRSGTVVSIESNNSITVTVGGVAESTISGVRYFGHYPPVVGKQVWLDTDGVDVIAVGALAGLGGPAIAARVDKNADQTLSTSAEQVTFASASLAFDPTSMFDAANNQFVIAVPGVYSLSAGLTWIAAQDSTARYCQIRITGTIRIATRTPNINSASVAGLQNVAGLWSCATGDTIQLWAGQSTGASLASAIQAGNSTFLAVQYVGPSA